jgi:hypothetical protein
VVKASNGGQKDEFDRTAAEIEQDELIRQAQKRQRIREEERKKEEAESLASREPVCVQNY